MKQLLGFGLALAVGVALAACTPQIIFMKDPQTGEVVQCGPDAERTAARDCANNYRGRGWVETPHASSSFPVQREHGGGGDEQLAHVGQMPLTLE